VRERQWSGRTTQPAQRPATYEDILALPEHVVGEIVDGELSVSPRPAVRHTMGTSALGGTLVTGMQFGDGGPGGCWILDEPEVHLAEHVVVPDIAGWRRERLPELPSDAFITVASDWICEALSPATARFDRTRNCRSMHASAFPTSGCSTRASKRSRPTASSPATGRFWQLTPATKSRAPNRSKPSKWT
jgi:hypothetical protein